MYPAWEQTLPWLVPGPALREGKQETAGSNVFKAADGTLPYASVLSILMIGEAIFYREANI